MRKTNIPTDKLLSILENLPKVKRESNSPSAQEIKQYIQFYNITTGEYFVPSFVIYKHYLNWCKDRRPFSDRIFFREFYKYFERKREFLYPFYKVNLQSIGLSYEEYEKIMIEVRHAQKEITKRNAKRYNDKQKNKAK